MAWGFLFSIWKSTGDKKREWCQSYEEMFGFDSLQELSVEEGNVCCWLSHLGVDFRHLLGFLLHPAAALFEQEDPCSSCSFLSHRLSHTPLSATSELCQGEWGRNQSFSSFCSWRCLLLLQAQTHRAPSRCCREAWWPQSWGLIRGRDETCGQGWHLWQLAVCYLGCPSWVISWALLLSHDSLRLAARCVWVSELCCSHSHLLHVLHASWEHKIRLLWSS